MFSGETEKVSFEADKGLLDVVFDFFKSNLIVSETADNKIIFSADVQVSKPFIAWCCSFGTSMKVTAPKSVVETIRNYLIDIQNIYT